MQDTLVLVPLDEPCIVVTSTGKCIIMSIIMSFGLGASLS